jgi:hypothetical protein
VNRCLGVDGTRRRVHLNAVTPRLGVSGSGLTEIDRHDNGLLLDWIRVELDEQCFAWDFCGNAKLERETKRLPLSLSIVQKWT